ncbi:MAG: alanine racemase, partial [Clostridia bacterium]|nr:alanine racemase [Clostridia bacterium]
KEFKQIINLIKKNKNIIFEGIYTHFFSSKNKLINKKQMNKFIKFIDLIPKKYNPIKHVGGSNLIYEELPKQIDMVRLGLFMYGYGAIDATPVMKVVTKIVNIINIKKGDYVGYDENFRATKKMTIAVVPLGYADGFSREISHKLDVVVKGKKCKVLGLVCMDMFMIDISQTSANIGDEICVFYNAAIWAEKLNQSEYEVLTSLNKMRANYLLVE